MKNKSFKNRISFMKIVGVVVSAIMLIFLFVFRSNAHKTETVIEPTKKTIITETAETPTPMPTPTPTPFVPFDAVITGNNVRFRAEPNEESGGEKSLYWGNIVKVIKPPAQWWEIQLNEEVGYIHSNYIKAVIDSEKTDGDLIKDMAMSYVGYNYKWGAETPEEGFDCSGFTMYIFNCFGIKLNRIASEQALNGIPVEIEDMQVGDLVLFKYAGVINHVGIYIGDDKVVHAANKAEGVRISPLSDFFGAELLIRRFVVVERN